MVVGQHDGNGSGEYSSLEYFSWGNWGRVGGTDGYDRVGGNLILSVEVKSNEVFPTVVRED